jgi:hypothetical protein
MQIPIIGYCPVVTPMQVIAKCFLGVILFWLMLSILVPNKSLPLTTLANTYLCAMLSLVYLLIALKKIGVLSKSMMMGALLVFSVRVLIGVLHYIYFIDEGYFDNSSPEFNYIWDYAYTYEMMIQISGYWHDNGFMSLPDDFLSSGKNKWLLPYMALLYFVGENKHPLDVAVLNSLHNVYSALLVTGYTSSFSSKKHTKTVFIISLLQPFGVFSSVMWRDSVGQTAFIAGAIAISQIQKNLTDIWKGVLGVLLMMSLRSVYFVIGVAGNIAAIYYSWKTQSKGLVNIILAVIVMIPLLAFLGDNYALSYLSSSERHSYNDPGGLPKKLLNALVGPYPWTQVFDVNINGREFIFQDVLQALYSTSLWIYFILSYVLRQTCLEMVSNKILFIIALITTLIGALSFGYVPYVTLTTIMLLPIIKVLSVANVVLLWSLLFSLDIVSALFW